MSKYKDLSKEELLKKLAEFEKELKNKKYGLVWESEKFPEQVVLECENNLPVLEEAKDKEIKTLNCEEDYNILIQGDNYHALTVLNYTHENKIDVIYIDPPYNTGNKDFIYNDHFVDKEDSYRHSKWLNFVEKRLKLAKNLLKEDGVIFISIDDNEQAQLKLLCDKIFGEENFVSQIIWRKKYGGGKGSRYFVDLHEYIFCYSVNKNILKNFSIKRTEEKKEIFKLEDEYIKERGKYYIRPLKSGLALRKTLIYPIECPDGSFIETQWICAEITYKQLLKEGKIVFKKLQNGNYNVYKKFYEKDNEDSILPDSIFFDLFYNQNGKEEIKKIFSIKEGRDIPFENPKPKDLISYLIGLSCKNKNSIILDFFAGSGTTGHAVLDLNKEDSGNRKFILCTNNQNNICEEVTYKRLEKVMNGYNKNGDGEFVEGLGGNLKYFKTSLVKKSKSRSQLKIDITQKCSEMLCLKESIFDEVIKTENYKIFTNTKKDKHLAIYYNFVGEDFAKFLDELKKLNTEIIVYIFSVDNSVDKKLFKGLDVKLEAIPQKILEVYKTLAKMNISANSETIFSDFEKAKNKIFEEGEKDEGARTLRVILEKILQKTCQVNGIEIINTKGKNEKTSLLNDSLKNKQIIDQVTRKNNELYLTIGNKASHGEYYEYDLIQVQNFYKHIQFLIDKFNV